MATDAATRRGRPETAASIERAAIRLVLRDGYEHVTVDMICEAAGVSQRTFFNYFKTKDAALLGAAVPVIDRERAAAFVASDGPLLAEAIGLVRVDPALIASGEELFVERIRAISSNPELLARQLERLAGIETELRDIVIQRLRRVADAQGGSAGGGGAATALGAEASGGDGVDLDAQADLITNLLAGTMRYLGQAAARSLETGAASPDVDALMKSVLPKLG
jgi:AcrR family transcriptional regulator